MSKWDIEDITDEDLFEFFPAQCFPDIEELELRMDEKALHIIGADSEWVLQADISLASGPGCMSFFYAGELRFQVEVPGGTQNISMDEAQQKGIPKPEELRLVKRGQPWEFIFNTPEERVLKIFADITSISWAPDQEE